MAPPGSLKNKPGTVLNRLETSQLSGWQTGKQTVAVVKSTVHQCMDQRVSSVISEGALDEV